MRDTAIVAGRLHPVMGAQRVITPGQVLAGIGVEVAERRAPHLAIPPAYAGGTFWPASPTTRFAALQPLGQGHIAFAAEDDVRMLEA